MCKRKHLGPDDRSLIPRTGVVISSSHPTKLPVIAPEGETLIST